MRVKMSVAAPLRVGGREQQINKLEFVRDGRRIHAVSTRRLAAMLLGHSERALDDWNAEVLTKGQGADLTRFLDSKGLLDDDTIAEISRYAMPDVAGVSNEFFPHTRDARGSLFIPGTAIKGAIRAAVMWALVDEKRANDYVPEQISRAADKKRRPSKKWFGQNLDKEKVQSYELPRRKLRTGPHHDLLRAVKVSDAYGEPRSQAESVLIQSYSESQRGRMATKKTTVHVECLVPDSWVEFDLKVDENIIRDFQSQLRGQAPPLPFTDAGSLLKLARSFYEEVWEFEQQYYGAEKSTPEPSTEHPEEFPSQKEWITQRYGKLSRTERSAHREDYRKALKDFQESREQETESRRAESFPAVQDGHEMRLQEVREFYAGSSPGFRLGWGSGLMSTTVDLRLDERNMGKVLNLIDSRKHPEGKSTEGPKSRKLVGKGRDARRPMGWARLEEVRE